LEHAHNNWEQSVMDNGLKAALDSGARIWWCYHPMDRDNFPIDEQYRTLKNVKSELPKPDDLVRIGLAIDGLDGMSEGDIQQAKQLARELEAEVLTAHYLGGPWPCKHPHSVEGGFPANASQLRRNYQRWLQSMRSMISMFPLSGRMQVLCPRKIWNCFVSITTISRSRQNPRCIMATDRIQATLSMIKPLSASIHNGHSAATSSCKLGCGYSLYAGDSLLRS